MDSLKPAFNITEDNISIKRNICFNSKISLIVFWFQEWCSLRHSMVILDHELHLLERDLYTYPVIGIVVFFRKWIYHRYIVLYESIFL